MMDEELRSRLRRERERRRREQLEAIGMVLVIVGCLFGAFAVLASLPDVLGMMR